MTTSFTLGAALTRAFAAERSLVDQLNATSLELPWCRDVAVGKLVKLKYHYGPKWWVLGEGKWSEYSRTKQVVVATKPVGQGGFEFSWDLSGSALSFSIHGSYRGHTIKQSGTLQVSAYQKCDDCDNGKRNNMTGLRGPTDVGGRFDTWPKHRDRTRIVIVEPKGDDHEIEIDTDE